jgi:uncharacterized membrane protein YhaH (DUF805 family)
MLFSANGRIRRRDWWLWSISVGLTSFFTKTIGMLAIFGADVSQLTSILPNWLTSVPTPETFFLWAVMALFAWPAICISAKRWHDRNRSGWLGGATMVIQYSSSVLALFYTPTGFDETGSRLLAYIAILVVSFSVMVWTFVELGCLDGTKGPNRYGPSPKGVGTAQDVF